jgi:hypothetical protein
MFWDHFWKKFESEVDEMNDYLSFITTIFPIQQQTYNLTVFTAIVDTTSAGKVFFFWNPLLFASCTNTFSKWCEITRGMKRSAQ